LEYLKDAFISYSSKNSAIASKIKDELENNKFSIWLDTSELEYGVLLRDQIQSSIFDSRIKLTTNTTKKYGCKKTRLDPEPVAGVCNHTKKSISPLFRIRKIWQNKINSSSPIRYECS